MRQNSDESSSRTAKRYCQAGRMAEIVDSHKGADVIVTAKLLAEAPQALTEYNLQTLRALAGTAPVTRRAQREVPPRLDAPRL